MAIFKQMKFTFGGSFQCRLATDADPKGSSRSDPFGDLGQPPSVGWTFAYNELNFDRIIRTRDPVQLRSGLLDPFVPVTVTQIEVQPEGFAGIELPWQVVPADPLLGLPVSLGAQAMFDSAAGGGAGFEAILNCVVTFGDLLTVTPVGVPRLRGVEQVPEWQSEYLVRKPLALAPALPFMNATRLKVLTLPSAAPPGPPRYIESYANPFSFRDQIQPIAANIDFIPAGATGLLVGMIFGWSWTLDLTFTRFDGDTLVGRLDGSLSGIHSDL
jgi:hypothetical protein